MQEKPMTGYPSIDKPWLKYYNIDGIPSAPPQEMINDFLRQHIEGKESLTALSYFGREITYRELFQHIDEAASVLYKLGVRSGDRIMYLLPTVPETAYLMYGTSKLGAVADFVDPRPDSIDPLISAKKIISMLVEERAKFLIVLDLVYINMLQPAEAELREVGIDQIVLVSASDSMNGKAKLNYLLETWEFNGFAAMRKGMKDTRESAARLEKARNASSLKLLLYKDLVKDWGKIPHKAADYKPDMLALIVHTSGTTSAKPKPIPLTHDNINSYTYQSFYANMAVKEGDKALHLMPYFAAYGVINVVHGLLCHANNLIQVLQFTPQDLGKLIIKYKPQTIIGAPAWFPALKDSPELQKADLSFLTMAVYGGDTLEIEDEVTTNEFLRQRNCGCVLTKGHGMSEVCGCSSYAAGEYNVIGSMGIPLPFTKYAIVDPVTKEMMRFSDDQEYLEGELIISSGAVTPGVLDGKEIVPSKLYDGERYIFTRDIARMDRNGILTFLARNDRSFTRFDGYKMKPYEIEGEIKKYQKVLYCVVSPAYDSNMHGNLAIADLVLHDHTVPARNEQVEIVKELVKEVFSDNPHVSTRQIPTWFRFRTGLPMTKMSKIDYRALAAEPLSGAEVSVRLEETNISIGKLNIS